MRHKYDNPNILANMEHCINWVKWNESVSLAGQRSLLLLLAIAFHLLLKLKPLPISRELGLRVLLMIDQSWLSGVVMSHGVLKASVTISMLALPTAFKHCAMKSSSFLDIFSQLDVSVFKWLWNGTTIHAVLQSSRFAKQLWLARNVRVWNQM